LFRSSCPNFDKAVKLSAYVDANITGRTRHGAHRRARSVALFESR